MRPSKAVRIFCTPRVIKLFLVLKKVFKSLKEIFCRLELTAKTMLHKSVASVKFYSFRNHLFLENFVISFHFFESTLFVGMCEIKISLQRYLCFIFLILHQLTL